MLLKWLFTPWSTVSFGAVTIYLLNIRTNSMESKTDSENYFNLRTVAQVNNSSFGIIIAEAVSE
jgi:hypothetical protein